ncbi:precorrin-3B C17-methyltransferase [Thiohalospira halophila DSM 15071]|uniref:Precorrin-3B C17-methyltransferase n=1 Tax=Thiohalospira halophila DSM 15071 TaxID=1123397 RepID=A0A1I1Q4L3_9GAMM|nr:precorrin-3B C(17)-methyltransferase [Thiohalospira halophila]SFD16989.1 precorrin-3B C17-methyltransferase [Thiohalospira halophila DSM 15071]
MSGAGWVKIVGVGPGPASWTTPEADAVVAGATDLVGYGPYLDRVETAGQRRHASDNREELDRAAHALDMAADGARVAVISGGDPGIFAMAAAVLEALEGGEPGRWDGVGVGVVPGLSALQAVAARAGAPLGNDFCAISLSDNLKPWALIEHRLRLAAEADFAIALYNPISRARPWQLGAALELLRAVRAPATPVVLGTAVGRGEKERVVTTTLAEAAPEQADMSTLLIIGASTTRRITAPDGSERVYTPRWHEGLS